jgi:hypothetical protein
MSEIAIIRRGQSSCPLVTCSFAFVKILVDNNCMHVGPEWQQRLAGIFVLCKIPEIIGAVAGRVGQSISAQLNKGLSVCKGRAGKQTVDKSKELSLATCMWTAGPGVHRTGMGLVVRKDKILEGVD